MADNATKIADWLKRNKGKYFCHTCVSEATGVAPQAQVNQSMSSLGTNTNRHLA